MARRRGTSSGSADQPPNPEPTEEVQLHPDGGESKKRQRQSRQYKHGPDVLAGRPDLAKDALIDLKRHQAELKKESARLKRELKAKRRRKARLVRKVEALESEELVQVLLERGVKLAQESAQPSQAGKKAKAIADKAASTPEGPGPGDTSPSGEQEAAGEEEQEAGGEVAQDE